MREKSITVTCALSHDISKMLEGIRDHLKKTYVEMNNISKSYAIKAAIKFYYETIENSIKERN